MEEQLNADKSWKRVLMIAVDPLMFIIKMTTHIAIMSAKEREVFLKNMLVTSIIFEVIGVIDLVFYHRWPLVVAQIPVIIYVLRARDKVSIAIERDAVVEQVKIDTEQVEKLGMTIYDDLDRIVAEDVKPSTPLEGLIAGAVESKPATGINVPSFGKPQVDSSVTLSHEQISTIMSKLHERKSNSSAMPESDSVDNIFGM